MFRSFLLILIATTFLVGCPTPDPEEDTPLSDSSTTFINLDSDVGDWIGQGESYRYTLADALITVVPNGNYLSIKVDGDDRWTGSFQLPESLSRFEPGSYNNLERYPFHVPAVGGLDWYGEGRGCNTLIGWIEIIDVIYDNDVLVAIELRFGQHCEGGPTALYGHIRWSINDPTTPPGPVNPPPATLWKAEVGVVPDTGNYVYLKSDSGYLVDGQIYTQADALITTNPTYPYDALFSIQINGDEDWWGDFQGMNDMIQLEPGYYGDLQRWPFHNPVKGGLSWTGDYPFCNDYTGWFVVDNVTYESNVITSIDLRFERRCDLSPEILHGQIHWDVNDTTSPPGPINPPPVDLWQPAVGSTPATGNYVYFESDTGDWVGLGLTYLYTPADSTITVDATDGLLDVNVSGTSGWNGNFQTMVGITQLEPGYYGDLQRYPFHNPAKGGLTWSGEGRGCNQLTGWFVIDSVTYVSGVMTAIDLRFEQYCEGNTSGLRGKIHWVQ